MPKHLAASLPLLVTACSLGGITLPGATSRGDANDTTGEASDSETTDPTSADETSGAQESTTAPGSEGPADDTTAAPGDTSGGGEVPPPGTVYLERDYEEELPEEVFCDEIGALTYVPGGGFEGSNAWQMRLFGDAVNEDHCGWPTVLLPSLDEGGTRTLYIGHLLYLSGGMVDRMELDNVGGKMLDVHMLYQEIEPRESRQTSIWSYRMSDIGVDPEFADTAAGGVLPQLVKGGAGSKFVRQSTPQPFDLRDYTDQWIWTLYAFDAELRTTTMWVATADGVFTGAYDQPLMVRQADDPADWHHLYGDEEPYVYDTDAWQDPGLIWGYWDNLAGKPLDADDFVRLDHLVISSGWIPSPI
ncbi:MAG TPA: hypothetical protein VG755_35325 [Nannocystaceae bacterium]|nr:hypothetical protein [Nannocystaceae bacterium]